MPTERTSAGPTGPGPARPRRARLIARGFIAAALLALFLVGAGVREHHFLARVWAQGTGGANTQSWEPTIREFEARDKTNPPKPGSIVFTGSSSFARWSTLAEDMKPLAIVNRAFGGSEYSDVDQYAKRIVNVYSPPAVVVYAGDNDLAPGSPKTPQIVADDVTRFVQIVHTDLPNTWIYVVSIKPSKLRWSTWPQMKAADQLIQDYIRTQQRVQYIDVATPMFDAQGNLPADLFVSDGLHPSPKLYAMWAEIIKPILLQRFAPAQKSTQNNAQSVPQIN